MTEKQEQFYSLSWNFHDNELTEEDNASVLVMLAVWVGAELSCFTFGKTMASLISQRKLLQVTPVPNVVNHELTIIPH